MLDGAIIILLLLSRSHTFHWMRWFCEIRKARGGRRWVNCVQWKYHRCCDMQARNSNMTSLGMSMKEEKELRCDTSDVCATRVSISMFSLLFLSISRAFCFSISRISWGLVLPEKRVLSPSTLSLFCLVFEASTLAWLHPNDIKMKHQRRMPDKLHSSSSLVKRSIYDNF